MTEYWKCEGGFKQLPEWEADCWIQVTGPTPEELDDLERRFNAPMDFIQDVEDNEERPRTDSEGGWLMTLIRVPNKEVDEDGDSIYSTIPMAILVHGEVFISICYYRNEMVDDFIRWTRRKMIESRERYDLMLSLFLSSSVWYLKYLKQMNIMMKAAEEALEESMDNDRLQQMMRIEKFLVYFITSMRGNEVVLVRLKKHLRHLPYDEDLLDDVEVELQQAYATANIYSEVLERQRDSYSSIISNNLNAIMKRLTTITIILMIPAAISGFYGMNVPNGWEEFPMAFPTILLSTVIIIIICVLVFKKKNLF
ncbi:MAG: magnesium transporter CorA family protein [Bacteroidales bacterium]|nr:magnesium transporter CorA family protein [Candidatus Liminaster caballi]